MLEGQREAIGEWIGKSWAPAIGVIAKARHARMFHPVGLTFAGEAIATGTGELAAIGDDLAGRVLARCSAALWKRPIEHLDVLGMALRFRACDGPELDEHAAPGDQDLLFATIISPLTMFVSPFTTNAHDFLANRYWAVSPFITRSGVRIKLRLVPAAREEGEGLRDQRLRTAVQAGRASLTLEARRTLRRGWEPVAQIVLDHEVDVAQEELRFDPFRSGAGLEPVGLVHAIRRAAYAASQHARELPLV